MNYLSSLSPEEYFHINGKLPDSEIERLLDVDRIVNDADDAVINIEESKVGFVYEDFLEDELDKLSTLSHKLRGENKLNLTKIISEIKVKITKQINSTDYANEKLDSVLDILSRLKDD